MDSAVNVSLTTVMAGEAAARSGRLGDPRDGGAAGPLAQLAEAAGRTKNDRLKGLSKKLRRTTPFLFQLESLSLSFFITLSLSPKTSKVTRWLYNIVQYLAIYYNENVPKSIIFFQSRFKILSTTK